jgi:2-polyprenyl-3-methyl-5-hydroxy-6-metoxy-1,4-benzoquinol methylase
MKKPDAIKINQPWPENGFESLQSCPACGMDIPLLLHKDLSDRVFWAPGKWTMYQCGNCNSGYLNPRPTIETINLAYETYYTHPVHDTSVARQDGFVSRVRRSLANGYLNWRFGTRYKRANYFGIFISWLNPKFKNILNRRYRHIPKISKDASLLDVGFGDGSFLERAKNAGWTVTGVDSDLVTVRAAKKRGLNVLHGGIEVLDDISSHFDMITLSHVIEHVHDPRAVLRKAYRLLKPGGIIWLETPNIDSFGHNRFGRHWRGLEPPRHLVIFNWDSLEKLLEEEGFCLKDRLIQYEVFTGFSAKSRAIESGADPYQSKRIFSDKFFGLIAKFMIYFNHRHSEFVTVQFVKSDTGK